VFLFVTLDKIISVDIKLSEVVNSTLYSVIYAHIEYVRFGANVFLWFVCFLYSLFCDVHCRVSEGDVIV
jgi:hypothetical protein